MAKRIDLATWYAILLCVWAIPTVLVIALAVGIGPIGPRPDAVAVSAHGVVERFWPLLIWLALPLAAAPFGLECREE